MTSMPTIMALQMAQAQQNAALSMIKSSADAERGIVAILENSAGNVPVSESRGARLDIRA